MFLRTIIKLSITVQLLLLAKLNQLKVLIQIVPKIILLRPFRSRKNLGLSRKSKLLCRILTLNITLILLVAGLVVVDLIGVNLSAHKILPVAMAALDGLGHELGVLVVSSDDLENRVAAGDLVVLGLSVKVTEEAGITKRSCRLKLRTPK